MKSESGKTTNLLAALAALTGALRRFSAERDARKCTEIR